MKLANYGWIALLVTLLSSTVSPISAQEPNTTVDAARHLNLMPVPASVQLQTGRLPITNAFSVATKGFADDRLRGGIARMTRRLAGRTVIKLPPDLAVDERTATLVIHCEGAGKAIPSLN
jgi:hypothetical protein